jgi:Protein of unknown function (DUF4242)
MVVMPIFMDRHNMRDATAEQVAEAHRRDLDIQDKYGVKYMTYWYDAARGTGFCLVEAPDAETATHVHREAHGEIPSDIIPVDLAAVEAFLGRIGDPRQAAGDATPDIGAGLRAVLVTDIVGSTEMTARLGDTAALELVRVHDALVRRGLSLHAGREVKHTATASWPRSTKSRTRFAPPPTFSSASTAITPKRAKACGCASVFTPANRSPNTTTSSALRFIWRFVYAAKPRRAAFWSPRLCANCPAKTTRASSRSASEG